MVIIKSNEDIKTLEIGCLTFDDEETLSSVIFRGLGKALDPTEANKKLGIPFCKDIIKEEPTEQDDNQDPNPAELHTDKESVQEKEKQREIDNNQENISDEIQEKNTRSAPTKDIEEKKDEGIKSTNRELKVS